MSLYERRLQAEGFTRIAGLDEAGRGPLAGPVVAAACILPGGLFFEKLNDSKQLTAGQRNLLFEKLSRSAVYGVGIVDQIVIDRINILQAALLAMRKAIKTLPVQPDYLLIDGNQWRRGKIPFKTLVGGDGLSVSIAAASIIAKVTRDRIMEKMGGKWPLYGFKSHKGYGTAKHLEALRTYGPCPIHRKSFYPIKQDVGEVGRSDSSDAEPHGAIRKVGERPTEAIKNGEQPCDAGEGADDGPV